MCICCLVPLALAACAGDSPVATGPDADTDPSADDPVPADSKRPPDPAVAGQTPDGQTGDGQTGDAAVNRTEYRSVAITEDGVDRPLVDGTVIALVLADDASIGAALGCNSMGGRYPLDDGTDPPLPVLDDGLTTTEIGCDPARHEQDAWFAAVLSARPSVLLDGDDLTLVGTVGGVRTQVDLVERSVVDPDRPLEGTRWTVTSFRDGDSALYFDTPAQGSITFDGSTGEATGTDGCTGFVVGYRLDGDDVLFAEPAYDDPDLPADAGPDCDPAYAERFRAVFAERIEASITADRLELATRDSGIGASFRAG